LVKFAASKAIRKAGKGVNGGRGRLVTCDTCGLRHGVAPPAARTRVAGKAFGRGIPAISQARLATITQ
jgi:hypothetical protein